VTGSDLGGGIPHGRDTLRAVGEVVSAFETSGPRALLANESASLPRMRVYLAGRASKAALVKSRDAREASKAEPMSRR
jgi:hypothetical protein